MLELLSNPFVVGILSFIVGALFVYVKSWFKQKELKKEISRLEKNIVTTMDEHRLNFEKIKLLEEQINNQKVTIQLLKEKPSARNLCKLRQYAEACAMMVKNVPGFAQAWQNCLTEIAEKEAEENLGHRIFTRPLQTLLDMFKSPKAVIDAEEVTDLTTDLTVQKQTVDKRE